MASILLVEDEVLVRELAFEDLSDAGHEVKAAREADEALAVLRDGGTFDLLITDVRMPSSINGWQLAEEARRLLPDLKVVYITGMANPGVELRHGERILSKPYRSVDLCDTLEDLGLS